MEADQESWTPADREETLKGITEGGPRTRRRRLVVRLNRLLPHNPRCHSCYGPFAGVGGRIFRLGGFAPSRKNPKFCNT